MYGRRMVSNGGPSEAHGNLMRSKSMTSKPSPFRLEPDRYSREMEPVTELPVDIFIPGPRKMEYHTPGFRSFSSAGMSNIHHLYEPNYYGYQQEPQMYRVEDLGMKPQTSLIPAGVPYWGARSGGQYQMGSQGPSPELSDFRMNQEDQGRVRQFRSNFEQSYRRTNSASNSGGRDRQNDWKRKAKARHDIFRSFNETMDWKMILDKIVLQNDQQASLYLQQKLKSSGGSEREEIVDQVIPKCDLLMKNKFGNFLVQKCFEYGTPTQRNLIIDDYIMGNVLKLSQDEFGCHVIQKVYAVLTPRQKDLFFEELGKNVLEGILNKYSCRVFQLLFEGSEPNQDQEVSNSEAVRLSHTQALQQFCRQVSIIMKGKWVDVALQEFGSLAVQSIIENCEEDLKEDCTCEIMTALPRLICSKWGNWVVQTLLSEQSGKREEVIEHIFSSPVRYCTDLYGSKVIEKLIKYAESPVVSQFVDTILKKSGGKFRKSIPLIESEQTQPVIECII